MRIDKYLWCIRRFKTRSIATEAVRKERVYINGEIAKPSRSVKENDIISIKKEGITYAYKVTGLPKSRVGAKLLSDYMTDVTPDHEKEKEDFIKMMKTLNRKKGTGRPTKKERRDIDKLSS